MTERENPLPCVLLGGSANALSVARSLWRAAVPVDVLGGSSGDPPASWSRATRHFMRVERGIDPADAWLAWLRSGADESVILPCSDEGLEFIARHRHELEALGHHPAEANDEVVLAMLDKERTYELARDHGIPAPDTAALMSPEDLDSVDEFRYPCAAKPIASHVFARTFTPLAKGAYISDASEARVLLEPILAAGVPMLLTEVVDGTDECCSYYSYLDELGDPLVHFTKRKLRQYPTRFGLGTYHMTKWQPEVAELGLSFFQAIGLRGMGNVEFKRDARDGRLKLIECNPRFTNAQEQVRVSGIDFGLLSYARAAGTQLPPLGPFRENVGFWFPVGDLRALRQYRADGEWTIPAWLRSLPHRQAFPLFSLIDPSPSLHNAARHVKGLSRRVLPVSAGERAVAEKRTPFDSQPIRLNTPSATSRLTTASHAPTGTFESS